MGAGEQLLSIIAEVQDVDRFRELNWEGTFADYLDIVAHNPKVTRTAFQRLYDMILSYGTETYTEHRERITHYKFFDDPIGNGEDAIYGLDKALMNLVQVFKSASQRYGTERRVLLLHGPVGSSKSTIVRLLKKGLEEYSRTNEGALYSFSWIQEDGSLMPCPMNEEPLHLVPKELRPKLLAQLNEGRPQGEQVHIEGDLCPACRFMFRDFLRKCNGDWLKVLDNVRVRRVVLSEQDRTGIGTFQPKDEKNQDSTELTGDINYRKIAEYGSDSDPRAFNFDGEFNVANRGLIEFIEVLKLDVAFLYDLLGASQEHKIKPKKFPQTDIDEVIVGHSVAGETPIPFMENGVLKVEPIENLYDKDAATIRVLAMDLATRQPQWVPIRGVFRHKFSGKLVTSVQKWGVVTTTPNHSIYDVQGKPFYPHEKHEMLAVRQLPEFPLVNIIRLSVAETEERNGWLYAERTHKHDSQSGNAAFRAVYDVTNEKDVKALLKVMAWYAAEGHSVYTDRPGREDSHRAGIVISNADKAELDDLRGAIDRVYTGKIYFQEMDLEKHGAHRLSINSLLAEKVLGDLCGRGAANKTFPDFVFALPSALRRYFLDELVRGDGSRKIKIYVEDCSDEYRESFFEYRTVSSLLATKVGLLAASLGMDFSVGYWSRAAEGKADAYRIRFVNPKRRHHRFLPSARERGVEDAWVYDIECVGHHNFICGVGNVVCHNTNEPEYKKLQSNELMEAFRDRTVKIDIPYVTKWNDEIKIYRRDYNKDKIRGKHIAPHTIEMAAMWAVLTRLEEPKKAELNLLQKLKLYDGKSLPGYTEDNIRELRAEAGREGMEGISPRYVQDKISNALVSDVSTTCVNPFMVLNELEQGLMHHSLITSDELRKKYRELLQTVKVEYEDIVKSEVQRAISADEEALQRLAANYIDNVKAYTQREKVKNRFTGQDEEPDERLMRSIEEKIDIPESRKDDFRREIMNYIGALALDGKPFTYKSNERLHKALELKLFEDQKDSIKLTSLVSSVVDKETQEKIDVVKKRLVDQYGYCEVCATDVLQFVASIFARGDVREHRR